MGVRSIEKTLFQFIWRYSKREQFILLIVTSCLFPFLFLTLELPKRIINDAIGAQNSQIELFGITVSQVGYLALLCLGFFAAVLGHGLLKMRINTMKGILAERMLRRLRYGLIERLLHFPKPYFQRNSQGEIVTMITTETEPMGGLMGDALAQPVLQAGQMLTILFFLFLQSFWFGLAAIALIPLQAWLIPRLQRQINLLNKRRIREVRHLASLIGETAAGASELRLHGGWRYRRAQVSALLGGIFDLRFLIYQKKFFMKFVNNLISQLTPFLFFSVGGYLVIQGAVTIGALVAALAAYKDLSSPWKELLTYYNQTQDMSLRWETIVEKFAPEQGFDAALMADTAAPPEDLVGGISLQDVTVTDADGAAILQGISVDVAPGAMVAISAPAEIDRMALVDLLTREVLPVEGRARIGDRSFAALPQMAVAARIGQVNARPLLFEGTFRDNVLMPLMARPVAGAEPVTPDPEARLSGNSEDLLGAPWLDLSVAGLETEQQLRDWWTKLLEATASGDVFFQRALDQDIGERPREALAEALVALRPGIWERVRAEGLDRYLHRFDATQFNPALSVLENLVFAVPTRSASRDALARDERFLDLLQEVGATSDVIALSRHIVDLLNRIFGGDGTSHPLFRKLGLAPGVFERALQAASGTGLRAASSLPRDDTMALMAIAALISEQQLDTTFPEDIRARLVDLRSRHGPRLQVALSGLYTRLAPDRAVPGLTVLENALFARLSESDGARGGAMRQIVSEGVTAADVRPLVMERIFEMPVARGGANLPTVFAESLALARAVIKRPDILVAESPLASYDAATRAGLPASLRKLLPEATMIFVCDAFEDLSGFDAHLEIRNGRMVSAAPAEAPEDASLTADLARKVRALETTDLFGGLERRQLRLLAFGAKWFRASDGEVIFHKDDPPTDGAYMILSGGADLYLPDGPRGEELVSTVGPGTLVGELGLIRNEPRALSMRARGDLETLRLGAEEFLSVVEHDAATAFKLLQVVARYKL